MTSGSSKEQAPGTETPDLAALLGRNRSFVEHFESGDLSIRPRLATILLTCVDARVDPAHFLRLEIGDAVVIRNAGGRITPAVMADLAVLGVLAANMPGPSAMRPELVVIHHNDCSMSRLANPAIQEQVARRLGLTVDEAAAMAITDPSESVQDDIERLRQNPGTPDQAGRLRLRLRCKQRHDQPGSAAGPTPSRLLNPRLS